MATSTLQTYNVGGVMLKQPFKIRRLGHFGFNVSDMEKAVHFYRDLLGFRVSDVLDFKQLPHMRDDDSIGMGTSGCGPEGVAWQTSQVILACS